MSKLWDLTLQYPVHYKASLLFVSLCLFVFWDLYLIQCLIAVVITILKCVFALHCIGYFWRHKFELLRPLETKFPALAKLISQFERAEGIRNAAGVALGFPVPTSLTSEKARPSVLVTGGAHGLGKEMVKTFYLMRYNVTIWDINEPLMQETKKELEETYRAKLYNFSNQGDMDASLDGQVIVQCVDVSSEESVKAAVADHPMLNAYGAEVGGFDIVILNAGIVNGQAVDSTTEASIRRLYGVNVFQLFNVCRVLLPQMKGKCTKDRPKRIVIIGSMAGFAGVANLSDYNSSKAAVNCFSEALSSELRPFRWFGVTLVCPYLIDTGMFKGCKTVTFMRMLTSREVVDHIVSAIKFQKQLIVIPWIFLGLLYLKAVMPWFALEWIDNILGGSEAMKNFQGHNLEKDAVFKKKQ